MEIKTRAAIDGKECEKVFQAGVITLYQPVDDETVAYVCKSAKVLAKIEATSIDGDVGLEISKTKG